MKLFNKIIFIIFFFIFIFISDVLADNCSYTEQANLNKLASYVKVAYDITKDENGVDAVEISLYNITEDIYVTTSNDINDEMLTIMYENTDKGSFKFKDYNIEGIVNYKISVWSNKSNCSGSLRNFTFTKPMRNKFADLPDCKYSGMQSFAYCKEWINSKFSYRDFEIEEKIAQKKESLKSSYVINRSEEVKEDKEKKESNFLRNKLLLVIAFILAIIIDIVVIGLLVERVRRYNI